MLRENVVEIPTKALRPANFYRPVVLCVDDDTASTKLFQAALELAGIEARHFCVRHRDELLDFLSRRNCYTDAPVPDLILLDLYLPRRSGFEILQELRASPLYQHVPIVVFTASSNPGDRSKSLSLGASDYVVQGSDLAEYVQSVREACSHLRSAPA